MATRYEIRFTRGADQDLQLIHGYRIARDGEAAADDWLATLIERIATLRQFPDRGSIPPELQRIGMRDFRQVLCGPYRIIYRVIDATVFIRVIADGRRDLATLLEQRLLAR